MLEVYRPISHKHTFRAPTRSPLNRNASNDSLPTTGAGCYRNIRNRTLQAINLRPDMLIVSLIQPGSLLKEEGLWYLETGSTDPISFIIRQFATMMEDLTVRPLEHVSTVQHYWLFRSLQFSSLTLGFLDMALQNARSLSGFHST